MPAFGYVGANVPLLVMAMSGSEGRVDYEASATAVISVNSGKAAYSIG